MTPYEFNTIKQLIGAYWATLDIGLVKSEWAKKGLLTQNVKLSKGDLNNFGLELLPSVLAPKLNLCEGAGKCKYTCLAFSGVGNILKGRKVLAGELNTILKAKARKTFLFANDYSFFRAILMNEIKHKQMISEFDGKRASFRLNVTSDIDWSDIIDEMKSVQFYDYTKIWDRTSKPNYNLTFSVDERTTDKMITDKLHCGESVAIVFHELPLEYLGFPVIDGDENDNRYDDGNGKIIGLKYKTTIGGKDDTDFVR
jgi:hypothetical protein